MRRRPKEPGQAIATSTDRLAHHRLKCQVCRHPLRQEIEEEFVNWRPVYHLARVYEIEDYRSIYRHATATGLIFVRRANMRWALDSILERAPGHVNADSVIRAIRAYSCLDENNKWVEPPTNVIFSVADRRIPPSARSRAACAVTISPDQDPPPAVHTTALPVPESSATPSELPAPARPARRKRPTADASTAQTDSGPVIGESDPAASTQAPELSEPESEIPGSPGRDRGEDGQPDALPALEPRSPDVVEGESADEPTQSEHQPAPDPAEQSTDDLEPAQTVTIEYAAGFAFVRPKPFVFRR